MGRATLKIDFTISEEDADGDGFEISGDFRPEAVPEIIEHWLRSQLGAGADQSPVNQQDHYHIEIDWEPHEDVLTCRSDCGNKGLRDGILLYVLKKLTSAE